MTHIGPTGEQPVSHRLKDRGGLNGTLTYKRGLVHLDFQANFIIMTPEEARCLAEKLNWAAKKAEEPSHA